MIFDWYRVFNIEEFAELDPVQKTYRMNFEGIGEVAVRVMQGLGIGVIYGDVFLALDLDLGMPVVMDGIAAFVKENGDVYVGIEVGES